MRRVASLPVFALVLTLAAGGCASTGGGGGGSTGGDRDVLTAEQLMEFPNENLYEIIQRERRQWMRSRTAFSVSGGNRASVRVYVNGVQQSNMRILENYTGSEVQEVRRLDPTEAQQRFGSGHEAGAILVTLR